ncbi:GDSL-type esterase/lipase family protein [Wenyingzhuangia sp. chi5]|uniref:GDSL-type esterase/lipase family protein n=1 Tax=Wenyingzhuangia gilva TaxID=3057677 RepID=A0ABT8VTQ1_9FLAO|nr:SGNH/GDSL hydrolase family protein [Wenyingzhuangia sp. chi5]MDO3695360.1 GDSL-type esterase/lipase family protein [Wenyingzhuangia sp. chi5]
MKHFFYFFLAVLMFGCKSKNITVSDSLNEFLPQNTDIKYQGRGVLQKDGTYALVGSAASISISFLGETCVVNLKSTQDQNCYVAVELDGEYLGRFLVAKQIKPYSFKAKSDQKEHVFKIFKATEATTGAVVFSSVNVQELLPIASEDKKYIEFIGDSITCGALADDSDIPCDEGQYTDHHNAYLAYGPRVAELLNVDYTLSSVSGMGMYRNWNDENIEEPIMPDVYKNLSLNRDASQKYKFIKQPDLVSICLGTNDLSGGDGIKERLPFNPEKYTQNYINFIKMLYVHYPNTKIALLNSPMVAGENNEVLLACLENVKNHFSNKDIFIFEFNELYVTGCSYHPSIKEHQEMANKLMPFYNKILNN